MYICLQNCLFLYTDWFTSCYLERASMSLEMQVQSYLLRITFQHILKSISQWPMFHFCRHRIYHRRKNWKYNYCSDTSPHSYWAPQPIPAEHLTPFLLSTLTPLLLSTSSHSWWAVHPISADHLTPFLLSTSPHSCWAPHPIPADHLTPILMSTSPHSGWKPLPIPAEYSFLSKTQIETNSE